jgi:hypothetical protein
VPVWRYLAQDFLQNAAIKAKSFVSIPTRGGDAFGLEPAESRRIGSLGLSLALEGLLLVASLRLTTKATSNDPRQRGPWVHVVFVCTRLFYMWSNAPKTHHRGFGRMSRVEVATEDIAEGCGPRASQHRNCHWLEADTSLWTRVMLHWTVVK